DLRSGELRRHLYWTTPAGATVELSFRRVASVSEPNGAALRVDVTPLDRPVTVRVRARIDGMVENDGLLHWRNLEQGERAGVAYLCGETRRTHKTLVEAMTVRQSGAAAPMQYY
ncbi:MAG: hypothetical protein CUN48_19125, partial [Candidatus Thermofonsia Clade 3 bacterium]